MDSYMTDKNLGGRPSKFTAERCARIIQAIYDRIPYEIAAESNGICVETLYEWINQGRADTRAEIDSEKAKFSNAIKEAEASRIKKHLENIDLGNDKWQGQAWILERRWYRHFSQNVANKEISDRLDELEAKNAVK